MSTESYKLHPAYDILKIAIHGKLNGELSPVFQLEPAVFSKMAVQEIFIEARAMYDAKQPITTAGLIHRLGIRLKGRPLLEPITSILIDLESEKHEGEYLAGHLDSLLQRFQEVRGVSESVGDVRHAANTGSRKITTELREWIELQTGYFFVTNCYKELHLLQKEQQSAARVVISRLVKEGSLDKHPTESGRYRRVENHAEAIDFLSVSNSCLDLKWPFEVERLYRAMPKNIVIVAGCPDSGKSAFCLDFVRRNMGKHEIYYFSSEMGAMELRDRLSKFDMPLEDWKRCKFLERSSNFADVVRPDAINIIDFLEISNDPWMVGGYLRTIHDKLRNGICIVALQKKRGQELGRGAEFSLEKPRLYLSMESGCIKIIKCKNWFDSQRNPNGLSVKFKLVAGCKFQPISGWIEPEH